VGLPAGVWLPIVRGLRDGEVFDFALLDFALLDLGLVGFCALDVGLVGFEVLDFRLVGFGAAAAGAAAAGVAGAAPCVTPRDGAAVEMLASRRPASVSLSC